MKQFYNVLGQIFGFLTIALYAFLFISTVVDFNVPSNIMDILQNIKFYAVIIVVGLAGLEFVAGKKLLAFIYFILLAVVIIFSFFPEVRDQITNML